VAKKKLGVWIDGGASQKSRRRLMGRGTRMRGKKKVWWYSGKPFPCGRERNPGLETWIKSRGGKEGSGILEEREGKGHSRKAAMHLSTEVL